MNEKKKKTLNRKLQQGSAALTIGASLLLPFPKVVAAKSPEGTPTPTVRERIQTIREKLGQSVDPQQLGPNKNTLRSGPQLFSQWVNWGNWRNW